MAHLQQQTQNESERAKRGGEQKREKRIAAS